MTTSPPVAMPGGALPTQAEAALRFGRVLQRIFVVQGIDHVGRLAEVTSVPSELLEKRVAGHDPAAMSMAGWVFYGGLLEKAGASRPEISQAKRAYMRFQQAWELTLNAPRFQAPPSRPLYTPAVVTRGAELVAASSAEFCALLRTLCVRSGVATNRIAERSGIPRAQTYALIKEGRDVLPKYLDQVRKFAVACGLTPDKVRLVEALWVGLREPAASVEVPPNGLLESEEDWTVLGDAEDVPIEEIAEIVSGRSTTVSSWYRHPLAAAAFGGITVVLLVVAGMLSGVVHLGSVSTPPHTVTSIDTGQRGDGSWGNDSSW